MLAGSQNIKFESKIDFNIIFSFFSPASNRKTNGHVSYADTNGDHDHGGDTGSEKWSVVTKVHDVVRRLTLATLSVPDQVLWTLPVVSIQVHSPSPKSIPSPSQEPKSNV